VKEGMAGWFEWILGFLGLTGIYKLFEQGNMIMKKNVFFV